MASIVIRTITQDEPSLEHIAGCREETVREHGPSYSAVLKFMYDHYKGREPQEKYLGIGQEDVPAWNTELIEMLQQGISVFAHDTDNQLCVGVCICGVVSGQKSTSKSLEQIISKGYPRAQALSVYLDNLLMYSSEKFQEIASSAHSMFFVAYVTVREEYGGRSIGRQMVQYCLEEFATKREKHQYAYAVCSSKFSQRIFEKLGFQQVSELRFVDVEVDGKHVIQEHLVKEPHTHSKGYVLKIGSVIGCE